MLEQLVKIDEYEVLAKDKNTFILTTAEKREKIEKEIYENSLRGAYEVSQKEIEIYQKQEENTVALYKDINKAKIDAMDDGIDKEKAKLKLWHDEQLILLQLNEEGKLLLKQLYQTKIDAVEKAYHEKQSQRQKAFLRDIEGSEVGNVQATYNYRRKQAEELFKDEKERNRVLQVIERDRTKGQIKASVDALSIIGSAFAEHTAMYKTAAIAQATWNTYNAANAALDDAPVPLNFALAAAVVAAGLINVSKIAGTNVGGGKGTAYATGGFALVGEVGPEIIAPATDYATGQALLINQVIRELRNSGVSGSAGGVNDAEVIKAAIIEGFKASRFKASGKDMMLVVDEARLRKNRRKI
jgi:hypothetical protein